MFPSNPKSSPSVLMVLAGSKDSPWVPWMPCHCPIAEGFLRELWQKTCLQLCHTDQTQEWNAVFRMRTRYFIVIIYLEIQL